MFCKCINTLSALALLLWGGLAQATLHDRGNGLIYDDVLNVTWLQDANLAATETFGLVDIDPNGGFLHCWTPMLWINALNAANYKGFNDWRLPGYEPVNGVGWNKQLSYDGSTDVGYNISAPGSAYPGTHAHNLAHLFYQSLGNQGWFDVNGNRNAQSCPDDAQGCLHNTGPFINLLPAVYFHSQSACFSIVGLGSDRAWYFDFRRGLAVGEWTGQAIHVLPYRVGDVLGSKAVPVLSPWLLGVLGSLLLMLGAHRLRKRLFQ